MKFGESPNREGHNPRPGFVIASRRDVCATTGVPGDSPIRPCDTDYAPLVACLRFEHMNAAVEPKLKRLVDPCEATKTFRWLLTMDVDCFKGGTCSTNDFMTIVTPDAQGRFTKTLARQSGNEAWLVPELGNKLMWGMSYKAADFMLSADENDPKKRTLRFVVKRLPRPVQR